VHKLNRRARSLSSFNYRLIHIVETDNSWADLLSRWGAGAPYERARALLLRAPVQSTKELGSDLPTLGIIGKHHAKALKHSDENDPPLRLENSIARFEDGTVWIPALSRRTRCELSLF
jgi:hypothetical protein